MIFSKERVLYVTCCSFFLLNTSVQGEDKDKAADFDSDSTTKIVTSVSNLCDSIVALPLRRAKPSPNGLIDEVEEIVAWNQLSIEGHQLFLNGMDELSHSSEQFIREYLNQALSRPGPEGFRLLLAAEGVLFSIHNAATLQYRGETWLRCSRESAKHQLELLSQDKSKRAAIYQFLVWRGRNINRELFATLVDVTIKGVINAEESAWYGRNFAILAIATSREDLLDGMTEENVGQRCALWARWLGYEARTLRASSAGWFWYADPNAGRVDAKNPWENDGIPDPPPLIVYPSTPLPNWVGEVLPLRGDQYLNHS